MSVRQMPAPAIRTITSDGSTIIGSVTSADAMGLPYEDT
jgi:hypothetical protein